MSEIDLQTRFPEMQPVTAMPSLGTMFGTGLKMWGYRDDDDETGTYVKTQCICLFGIPIFSLRAFRIANWQQGIVLIGREPLSLYEKTWNFGFAWMCVILACLSIWITYTTSPEYIARTKLADADSLVSKGKLVSAAEKYQTLFVEHPDHADRAAESMKQLLKEPIRQATLADADQLLRIAIEFQWGPKSPVTAADIEECGRVLVEKSGDSDPNAALALLDTITPIASKPDLLDTIRLRLLMNLMGRDPDNQEWPTQLAAIHERRGELEKCRELLEPLRSQLGNTEGARILGQIDSRNGDCDQAVKLLSPYVAERLPRLRDAEQAYQSAIQKTQKTVVELFKKGKAPADVYRRARSAPPAERERILGEYLTSQLQEDVAIKKCQQRLMIETNVVPVALKLGMARLNRAQTTSDQEVRRHDLEEAEKNFIAIRGVAGETDEFRVYLGQVYYWLGKPAEGRKLFDELLNSHQRSFKMLVSVGQTLFDLGAISESRALAEEAYNSEQDKSRKYRAATMRAIVPLDEDDQLKWLHRADPTDPEIQALLNDVLARRAIAENRDDDAEKHLRKSIEARSGQPEDTASLNNGAQTFLKLFQLTGNREDFTKGVKMLDRAVKLSPDDGVLLLNTAKIAIESALLEIIGDRIDLRILKQRPQLELLSYLYDDEADSQQFVETLNQNAEINKAIDYLDRAAIVAPKNQAVYERIRSIQYHRHDSGSLRKLQQRLDSIELDFTDAIRRLAEYTSGTLDEKNLADLTSTSERNEELMRLTRNRPPATTFAVATGSWLTNQMARNHMGIQIDFDELVRVAEEAHVVAPSTKTRQNLYLSLMYRASNNLAQTQPTYAHMLSRTSRSLSPSTLIAVVLSQPGDLRQAVVENLDVGRATKLIIEEQNKIPHRGSPWDWAMVQAFDEAEATRIRDQFQHDEFRQLSASVSRKLSPPDSTRAFNDYWTSLMAGDPTEAIDILKRCADQGIPLPFDP